MAHDFPIETDMPLPARRVRNRYGWARMEIGNSIFIPQEKLKGTAHEAGRKFAARNGLSFVFREVEGGLRVWRT